MSERELLPLDNPAVALMREPEQVIAEAQRAAKAILAIVEDRPEKQQVWFNGRRYVNVSDYNTLGAMFGLSVKPEWTRFITIGSSTGWESRTVIIRDIDGAEVGAGEAMCMDDEENWGTRPKYEWMHKSKAPEGATIAYRDGVRVKVLVGEVPVPEFQRRSMAQTRAAGKALRLRLGYVVVLAGFEPSAVEEMTGREHDSEKPRTSGKPDIKPPQRKSEPTAPAASDGHQEVVGPIRDIAYVNGETDGKPWERWGISVEGVYYGTFSKSIAENARLAKDAKADVVVVFEVDHKNRNNIVFLEEVRSADAADAIDTGSTGTLKF